MKNKQLEEIIRNGPNIQNIEAEFKLKEDSYLQIIDELRKELNSANCQNESKEPNLNDSSEAINEMLAIMDEEKQKYEGEIQKLNAQLKDKDDECNTLIEAFEQEKNELESKIAQLTQDVEAAKEEQQVLIQAFEEEKNELENKLKNSTSNDKNDGINQSNDSNEDEQLNIIISEFEKEKSELEKSIESLKNQLNDKNDEEKQFLDAFEEEKNSYEAKIKELENALLSNSNNISSINSNSITNADEINDVKEIVNIRVVDFENKLEDFSKGIQKSLDSLQEKLSHVNKSHLKRNKEMIENKINSFCSNIFDKFFVNLNNKMEQVNLLYSNISEKLKHLKEVSQNMSENAIATNNEVSNDDLTILTQKLNEISSKIGISNEESVNLVILCDKIIEKTEENRIVFDSNRQDLEEKRLMIQKLNSKIKDLINTFGDRANDFETKINCFILEFNGKYETQLNSIQQKCSALQKMNSGQKEKISNLEKEIENLKESSSLNSNVSEEAIHSLEQKIDEMKNERKELIQNNSDKMSLFKEKLIHFAQVQHVQLINSLQNNFAEKLHHLNDKITTLQSYQENISLKYSQQITQISSMLNIIQENSNLSIDTENQIQILHKEKTELLEKMNKSQESFQNVLNSIKNFNNKYQDISTKGCNDFTNKINREIEKLNLLRVKFDEIVSEKVNIAESQENLFNKLEKENLVLRNSLIEIQNKYRNVFENAFSYISDINHKFEAQYSLFDTLKIKYLSLEEEFIIKSAKVNESESRISSLQNEINELKEISHSASMKSNEFSLKLFEKVKQFGSSVQQKINEYDEKLIKLNNNIMTIADENEKLHSLNNCQNERIIELKSTIENSALNANETTQIISDLKKQNNKLTETNSKLQNVLNNMKDKCLNKLNEAIEEHLNDTTQKINQKVNGLMTSLESSETKIAHFHDTLRQHNEKVDSLLDEIKGLNNQITKKDSQILSFNREIEQYKSTLNTFEAKMNSISEELILNINSRYEVFYHKLRNVVNCLIQSHGFMHSQKIQDSQKHIEMLEIKILELQQKENIIPKLEEERNNYQKHIEMLENQLISVKMESENISSYVKQKTTEIEKLTNKLEEEKVKMQNDLHDFVTIGKKTFIERIPQFVNLEVEKKCSDLKTSLYKAQQELKDKTEELEDLKRSYEQDQMNNANRTQQIIQNADSKANDLSEKLDICKTEIHELKEKNSEYIKEIEKMKETTNNNSNESQGIIYSLEQTIQELVNERDQIHNNYSNIIKKREMSISCQFNEFTSKINELMSRQFSKLSSVENSLKTVIEHYEAALLSQRQKVESLSTLNSEQTETISQQQKNLNHTNELIEKIKEKLHQKIQNDPSRNFIAINEKIELNCKQVKQLSEKIHTLSLLNHSNNEKGKIELLNQITSSQKEKEAIIHKFKDFSQTNTNRVNEILTTINEKYSVFDSEIEIIMKKFASFQNLISELKQINSSNFEQLSLKENENNERNEFINEKLKSNLLKFTDLFNEMLNLLITKIDCVNQSFQEKETKLLNSIENIKSHYDLRKVDCDSKISQMKEELNEMKAKLEELELESLEKIEKISKSGKNQLNNLQTEKDTLLSSNQELQLEINKLTNQYIRTNENNKILEEENTELKNKIIEIESEKSKLLEIIGIKTQESENLNLKVENLETSINEKRDVSEELSKVKTEISQLQIEFEQLKTQNVQLENEKSRINELNKSFENENNELNNQIFRINNEKELMENKNHENEAKIIDLENSNKEIQKELDKLLQKESRYSNENAHLIATVSNLTIELETVKNNQLKETASEIENLHNENNEMKSKIESLKQNITELSKDKDSLNSKNIELSLETTQKSTEIARLSIENDESKLKISTLSFDNEELTKQINDDETTITKLKEKIKKFKDDLTEKSKEITDIKQQVTILQAQNSNLSNELVRNNETTKIKIEELQSQNNELAKLNSNILTENEKKKQSISDLQTKIDSITEKKDSLIRENNEMKETIEILSISNSESQNYKLTNEELQQTNEELKQTNEESSSKIFELENSIIELKKKEDEEKVVLNTENKEIKQNNSELAEKIESLTNAVNSKNRENIHLQEKIEKLNEKISILNNSQLNELNQEFQQISNEKCELAQEIEQYEQKIQKLNEQINEITQEKQHLIQQNAKFKQENEKLNEQFIEISNEKLIFDQENGLIKHEIENMKTENVRLNEIINQMKQNENYQNETRSDINHETKNEKENLFRNLQGKIENLTLENNELIEKLKEKDSIHEKQTSELVESVNSLKSKALEKLNEQQLIIQQKDEEIGKLKEKCFSLRKFSPQPKKFDTNQQQPQVIIEYVRKVLLQFFVQDDENKKATIPILLHVVGATDQEIQTAQAQWERSQHLITKATGFFGF
ncbi:hypothetical protein TRFO_39902 [Tritrichomonas foetus]|uniref:Uncharacterized protein n=1 Tax=Tritrichomonas foetus TaxID=1144522 RepID=A0A1J4J5E9_9EUKA|nr:hypothetical protein TRFO_39902 [Tritrichomonas foetus]|eukprot:OHS93921.1 hypothetical protein TRFO_39902 [Tritrichomonas foetus]